MPAGEKSIIAAVLGIGLLGIPSAVTAQEAEAPQVAPPPAEAPQVAPPPAEAPQVAPPPAEVPQVAPPPAEAPQVAPPPAEAPQVAPPPAEAPQQAAPKDTAEVLTKLDVPIQFDGYFWVDTGYMIRTNAQSGQYDQSAAYMQGRYVLGASYLREKGDFYGLARGQFIGLVNEFSKSQYEPHTLDAFVQVGFKHSFDVQLGRFLAWEVYHRGQGIELFTAEEAGALGGPALYWLDQTRGYKNEAGQMAIHVYPFEFLKFELAGVYGQESSQNNFGVRPVVDFTTGGFQVIGGYEYLKQVPQTSADKVETKLQGVAGKLQYRFPVVTAGANIAWVDVNSIDIEGHVDSSKSFRKMSAGGFVDIDFWRNSIGLGYHHTVQKNERDEQNTHAQAFVSYLVRLPIDGLALKAVYGYAAARIEDADANSNWTNGMQSFRVRASFDFK